MTMVSYCNQVIPDENGSRTQYPDTKSGLAAVSKKSLPTCTRYIFRSDPCYIIQTKSGGIGAPVFGCIMYAVSGCVVDTSACRTCAYAITSWNPIPEYY